MLRQHPPRPPSGPGPLADSLDRLRSDLVSARPASPPPLPASSSSPPRPSTSAPSACRCRGKGTLLADLEAATAGRLIVIDRYGSSSESSALVVCPDCEQGRRRAREWSGLPPEAYEIRLDTLRALPHQAEALAEVVKLIREPRGWLTLAGGYGTGKTTLIYATLGYLAGVGVYGRYTTAPDLIDHLRDAIRDADGRAHSERLERLKTVPVLAVDELDKYRGTDYAEEAIFKLFDHRYRERARLVTLIGYNRERSDRIPPFLASRIRDGRFRLVELDGVDVRPAVTDEPGSVWDRGETP